MTGNNTTMTVLAVAFGLLAGFWILRLLQAARRKATVHADLPAAAVTPTLATVAPVLPAAPLTATVHYTDAGGRSSVREVVIHSRKLVGEGRDALNVREGGDPTPKLYLIERISRLDYTVEGEICSLTSAVLIRELLERVIPFKEPRSPRNDRVAPEPAPAASEAGHVPEPSSAQAALPLPSLLPEGACGFAVFDLETTGFGAEHRILEIAVIRLEPDGRIKDVWETLVHPGMAIPSGIAQTKHRIHDRMVANAPAFADVAADLAARLDGHVLVAHNLPFDQGFLERRFAAVEGIQINLGRGLNTMKAKESLESLCKRLAVSLPPDEAHSALVDARALAQALVAGISHLQPAEAAVALERTVAAEGCTLQPRSAVQTNAVPEGWRPQPVPLVPGAEFIKTDVADSAAEALAERLGLVYRQAKKVPKRRRPAFLLADDLASTTTKMREAKEQRLPVLRVCDIKDLAVGSEALGWLFEMQEEQADASDSSN